MEKKLVEPYKSQYVKLIKNSGEKLDGTIVEILENSVIFQTELTRSAISYDSIREIISYDEMKKRKQLSKLKI
ncbi:MAG: hypothetical protein QHH15_07735 [Candidatus Thermoplasmatota archaeon]|jgi:hypothetical protein|nr:hypothetical protein [Candidatus Thermoplasmatota archaeon]